MRPVTPFMMMPTFLLAMVLRFSILNLIEVLPLRASFTAGNTCTPYLNYAPTKD